MTTLEKLSLWQKSQAAREGVEAYRVVPFGVLKAVAQTMPASEEELLQIKGIGPAKVRKYGSDIMMICSAAVPAMGRCAVDVDQSPDYEIDQKTGEMTERKEGSELVVESEDVQKGEVGKDNDETDEVQGVGEFLKQLNQVMNSYFGSVRVRGEVIGFKRNQSGHAYFELKDVSGKGIMRCAVFARSYQLSGVDLSDGAEIILTGKPSHHTQYGFSFIGEHVALAGEGALKAAYEKLKAELAAEGLMAASRKKKLPDRPQRIGLITSPTGAAIGDFTTNIGKYGYAIIFAGASVEGEKSVQEILSAMRKLAHKDLDLLVIMRGGGSLESLQAFNNPNVVRAIVDFPVPVIAGIGHEQDETLSTLIADMGVSTPTAAARAVRASWDQSVEALSTYSNRTISALEAAIASKHQHITSQSHTIELIYMSMQRRAQNIITNFHHVFDTYEHKIMDKKQALTSITLKIEALYRLNQHRVEVIIKGFKDTMTHMSFHIASARGYVSEYEQTLERSNPLHLLEKGYSIARTSDGTVLRSVEGVKQDDHIEIQVKDGTVRTRVTATKG